MHYFKTFVVTLRREWNGIDHLRLDKFYLCIRRFVKAMFSLIRKCNWDLGLLGEFVGVLEDDLFLRDDKLGNGVGYHVVGVFLDELKGCFVPVRREVVDLLFRPFFGVMGRSLDKVLIGKVRGLVFEELVRIGKCLLDRKRDGMGVEGEEDEYDDLAFGLIAMRMGFAARFYEIGSSADCVQGNRKVLLKLHEDFLKLEKMLESSGIEFEIPDVVLENDDDEVPELIPIESCETDVALEQNEVDDSEVAAEEGEDMLDDEYDARKRKKARKGSDGRIKKVKTKKRKEKKNQPLDEDSSVLEACAPETENLVEASLKEESKSSSKKRKKKEKKNEAVDPSVSEASLSSSPINGVLVNRSSTSCKPESNGDVLNESVIANLQKQFENVAAELASDDGDDVLSLSDAFKSINEKPPTKKKKTKKSKSCDPKIRVTKVDGEDNGAKSADASAKRVRFAMKNNLVWKPHSPLPPQSLRIPPSVTPRGSALKKGVLPGPIREVPPAKKKLKKKGRKITMKTSVPWR